QGPHVRILDHVLRVSVATRQPQRVIECRVQVRDDDFLEASPRHVLTLRLTTPKLYSRLSAAPTGATPLRMHEPTEVTSYTPCNSKRRWYPPGDQTKVGSVDSGAGRRSTP